MAAVLTILTGSTPTGSTGTVDYTSTGIGTPDAAFVVITEATADDTLKDDAVLSTGITDGTDTYCTAISSEHGAASMVTYRRAHNDGAIAVLMTPGTGVVDVQGDFDSFITDGIRIDWSNIDASNAHKFTIYLWTGLDNVKAASWTQTATLNGTTTVSGLGTTAANGLTGIVLGFASNDETSRADARHSVGFLDYSGTTISQASSSWSSVGSSVPTSRVAVQVETDRIGVLNLSDTPAPLPPGIWAEYEVTDVSDGEITVTTRSNTGAQNFAGLFWDYGTTGQKHGVYTISSPLGAAPGVVEETTPGTAVQAVIHLPTGAVVTGLITNALAETYGVGGFTSGGTLLTDQINDEDNQPTSDTHSLHTTTRAVFGGRTAGGIWYSSNLTGANMPTDDGFELNWTTGSPFFNFLIPCVWLEVVALTGVIEDLLEIEEELERAFEFTRAVDEDLELRENVVRKAVYNRALDETLELEDEAEGQTGLLGLVEETLELEEEVEGTTERVGSPGRRGDTASPGSETGENAAPGAVEGDAGVAGSEAGETGLGGSAAGSDPGSV